MPGNIRKGLLAMAAVGLVMQTAVRAAGSGDYASPSQWYGGSQNRHDYYGNSAQPGGSYGYPYGGAPGYTAPAHGNAVTTRPAPAAGTAATSGGDSTAAEIAQLKQRVSELEAAVDRINSRMQAPAAAGGQSVPPDYPASEEPSGYPGTAPGSTAFPEEGMPPTSAGQGSGGEAAAHQGTEYGSPAAGAGQRRSTGNTGFVPRSTGSYVPPPQNIGPRVYEFNK